MSLAVRVGGRKAPLRCSKDGLALGGSTRTIGDRAAKMGIVADEETRALDERARRLDGGPSRVDASMVVRDKTAGAVACDGETG